MKLSPDSGLENMIDSLRQAGTSACYNSTPATQHNLDEDDIPRQTAAGLGLISCHHCATVWDQAQEAERCGRCNAPLHSRKPDSFNRTWALLIAACIMYIPANMMPVMITRTLLSEQHDTILSGIIYFWMSGDWELACIVFIASFLVPLFKLSAMMLMTFTAQRQSRWRRFQRAKLYRIVESIGRWSMLDVFVVSLLSGLVQISGFARIDAGVGVAAFGTVVILTMLASLTFDPRLIWDQHSISTSSLPVTLPDAKNSVNLPITAVPKNQAKDSND